MNIQELLNRDIVCECGKTHRCNIGFVKIGNDALSYLREATANYSAILLVADGNTLPLCKNKITAELGEKVKKICFFDTTEPIVPNEQAVEKIESCIDSDADLILGIGSGVINDLCKYVSFNHKIKSGIIATAPSMDGYASSGAAMIFDGMKITYTMHAPDIIIGDVDILKNAPMDMIRSGYGDIIGKYSSLNDWKLAHIIKNEHFCQSIYNIVLEATNEIRELVSHIIAREAFAIEKLMNALVLIGITLTLVNTTRPGSGSEHHLSHFYEITGLIHKEKHFTHGIDVAYNTVLTAWMRERICEIEDPSFYEESEDERMIAWERIFKHVAKDVKELQDASESYSTDLCGKYRQKWNNIIEILSECPSASDCINMIEASGLDITEYKSLYGESKISDALLYGKDLKNRYSVLWLYYSLFSGRSGSGKITVFDKERENS